MQGRTVPAQWQSPSARRGGLHLPGPEPGEPRHHSAVIPAPGGGRAPGGAAGEHPEGQGGERQPDTHREQPTALEGTARGFSDALANTWTLGAFANPWHLEKAAEEIKS